MPVLAFELGGFYYKFKRRKGDYAKLFHIDGQVYISDNRRECIGTIESTLVPRNGANLFMYCDSVSAELVSMATRFMNDDGTLRKPLRTCFGESTSRIRAAEKNSFLSIYMVKVRKEHRGNDLGLLLVESLFHYLKLSKLKWSLAGIRPLAATSEAHDFPSYAHDPQQKTIKLCRHFARLGFLQLGKSEDFYLENANATENASFASKEATAALEVNLRRPKSDLYGNNKLLTLLVSRGAILEVIDLVRTDSSVSIRESEAMFFAIAHNQIAMMLLLIAMDPGVVNAVNDTGVTPIACAAEAMKTMAVAMLLAAGADPNIRCEEGKHALDRFNDHVQGEEDFKKALGITLLETSDSVNRAAMLLLLTEVLDEATRSTCMERIAELRQLVNSASVSQN